MSKPYSMTKKTCRKSPFLVAKSLRCFDCTPCCDVLLSISAKLVCMTCIYRGKYIPRADQCFPVFSAKALADFLVLFSRIIYNNILFWLHYYSVLEGRFLYRTHKMLKYHENVNMCTKYIWTKIKFMCTQRSHSH